MLLVIPPATGRFHVDFLPDLPFAGCDHDTVGLMEIEASGIHGRPMNSTIDLLHRAGSSINPS